MSLIDGLNQIARMQGRPQIDPTVIVDEGGYEPAERPTELLGHNPDPDHDTPADDPVSPLVAIGLRQSPQAVSEAVITKEPGQVVRAEFKPITHSEELFIAGGAASFKGQTVELTQRETAAIARIVLGALQARLRAELDRLGVQRVRRIKAKPALAPAAIVAPVKRKPGRPKKVPNA